MATPAKPPSFIDKVTPYAVGLELITSIADPFLQIYGMQEARKENRKARAHDMKMFERTEGIRQRERKEDVKFREKGFAAQIDMQKFQKRQGFRNTLLTQLNGNEQLKTNFINAQRGRR